MSAEVKEDLKYTDTHEWVRIKGDLAQIGITDHAQSELTDIVFVELPNMGKEIKKGEELCVVESVKSVSEIYAPVSGRITNVNKKLEETPEVINESPYEEGWIAEIEIKDKSELDSLLDAEAYKRII
ncbi:MAG: glycine cleavage system protein GcvH [Thermoplasmata archaeon]|nr:MAG: glycine cleavage system protein GcvH [Thermoplasmata archaeon]RLF50211.1 MAG: glycine cleavage system protein GcvH [Thermoplasmata archaeon]